MSDPSSEKIAEWRERAAKKDAIVPRFFEVYPTKVTIVCGNCSKEFRRSLVPNIDEPVFVCPEAECHARNWVPVTYDLR